MTASTPPIDGVATGVIGHWIDGRRSEGSPAGTLPVFDPATGSVAAQVVLASTTDLEAVVASSHAAFDTWRHSSLAARTKVLFAFREILSERRDLLASVITAQHGKVLSDAVGEVGRGIEVVEFACGVGELLKGTHNEQVSTDVDVWTVRQPVGPCVGITPFNFPAMVPLWMLPVAVACGNSFILKPSERDPGASVLLAQWFTEAGLPDGVFNVLQGDATAVNGLIEHPQVRAVSFVGSTPIARHVATSATEQGKRVQALGGAKNHMIVLPDADLEAAADAAVSAGYGSAGERCMAISVVVAVDPVGDDLVAAIAERARALVIADGRDPGVDMGPLVTAAHRDRVRSYVDLGVAEGATLVLDGRDLVVDGRPDGFWLGPCLFDHVTTEMRIWSEEIFGPVLAVVRVASFDEAVALVDRSPFGNGVALFTRDGGAARRFQQQIDAGMVGINVPIPVPVSYHSFGGWGASLFGDTKAHGPEGVHFHTRAKTVTARWADPATRGPDLGFPRNT
ncbi:MAG: CoA-acylating methylmalonate-semialdehyde dehydrogenase [Acidobacteria bacterium]|nr:CoA-acylating methylmalonate-semialdehyde dehydrogenase [Acidobacteriota bacterium]